MRSRSSVAPTKVVVPDGLANISVLVLCRVWQVTFLVHVLTCTDKSVQGTESQCMIVSACTESQYMHCLKVSSCTDMYWVPPVAYIKEQAGRRYYRSWEALLWFFNRTIIIKKSHHTECFSEFAPASAYRHWELEHFAQRRLCTNSGKSVL